MSDTKNIKLFYVWLLAAAVTLNWASLNYIFAALLPRWESDLGWSLALLSSAFTGSLLVSALTSPFAGIIIDRGHGRTLMVGSAILGMFCLICLAFVQSFWQFLACWLLLGIAQAGALYEPCFALLTRIFGTNAKQSIIKVTLFAGFAGTISFPLAHNLADTFGWRGALICFAVIMAFSAYITHVALGHLLKEDIPTAPAPEQSHQKLSKNSYFRQPIFWLLAFSMTMLSFTHNTIITHLLPLLDTSNVDVNTAVFAASMFGPMQVVGRLAMMAGSERVSAISISIASFIALAIASAALLGTSTHVELLIVFVVLHGAGLGVTSITRPVIIAECFGQRNFGAIAGALALPLTASSAFAPSLGALIWSVSSHHHVVKFTIYTAIAGAITMMLVAFLIKNRKHAYHFKTDKN